MDSKLLKHVKRIVIDHHLTFIGYMKLDFRYSYLNTEPGMLVVSNEFAEDLPRPKDL